MLDNQTALQLHQKSFRGEPLTEDEREQLEIWYAYEDKQEAKVLQETNPQDYVQQLRHQLATALNQLSQLSQQIQQMMLENEKIRQENAKLLRLLSQKLNKRAA